MAGLFLLVPAVTVGGGLTAGASTTPEAAAEPTVLSAPVLDATTPVRNPRPFDAARSAVSTASATASASVSRTVSRAATRATDAAARARAIKARASRNAERILGRPLSGRQREVVALIARHFADEDFADAVRVGYCESRLEPRAVHRNSDGTRDYGVFQFNSGGTLQRFLGTRDRARDAAANVRAAARYHRLAGWSPWTCSSVL